MPNVRHSALMIGEQQDCVDLGLVDGRGAFCICPTVDRQSWQRSHACQIICGQSRLTFESFPFSAEENCFGNLYSRWLISGCSVNPAAQLFSFS